MAKECQRRLLGALKLSARDLCERAVREKWILLSWPWWIAVGIVIVPFTAQLWLLAWLLILGMLIGLRVVAGSYSIPLNALILLVTGLIWGSLWGLENLSRKLPEELVRADAWVTGTVVSLPEQRARAVRFKFNVESCLYQGRETQFKGAVLVSWYENWPELQAGQRWWLKLRLKPVHGSLNPGSFNYAQWLFARGVHATAYVRDTQDAQLLETRGGHHRVQRFREHTRLFIESLGLRYSGVIAALATGLRSGIDSEQWTVFRRTGTAHLVAISGLHIGMIAAVAYILSAWLWRVGLLVKTQYPVQPVARVMSVLAAGMYAAMAGFALPTKRALLMLLSYYILSWLGRNPDRLFSLGLVLLLALLIDPLAPLDGGFWLSFGAVLAIALGTRRQGTRDSPEQGPDSVPNQPSRLQQRLFLWWRVQWAVFLGLFPLTLFMFQQASLISPLANALAIPVFTLLIVPLILLGMVGFCLNMPAFAGGLLGLADTLLGGVWAILQPLSDWSMAVARIPVPHAWELMLAVASLLFISLFYASRLRWLGLFGLLPMLIGNQLAMGTGEYQLEVLDVGQGLAVVVRTRHHALLYDAGIAYPSGFDSGSAIVLPFLREQGISTLHVAVASHDNQDHSGGLAAVLTEFPHIETYSSAGFYPGSRACFAGQAWNWDGVDFEFLHPDRENARAGNNQSCVLRVRGPFGSALLSGDIERGAEKSLLQLEGKPVDNTDLLLVPHHGSRTSSTGAFLQRVKPVLGIVSAGNLNRFEHPHADVVRRYADHGIATLNTASSGWIKVQVSARGITATPYRAIYRRYWLPPAGDAIKRFKSASMR